MDLKLAGKIALVTGSSKGIGEGIARGLAREGVMVLIHGRDRTKAEEVAHDIVVEGGSAQVVIGDLTDEDQVQRIVADCQLLQKPVEIVVNNAGGSIGSEDWTTTRPETWAAAHDRNVLAAVRITAHLLPAMRAAKWGRIVNIASMAGLMPPAARPDYSAAKSAMISMTSSLAKAVATDGITANTISPGTIRSARLDEAFRKAAASAGLSQDAAWVDVEQTVLTDFAQVPMGRVGTLEELADAVAFLASPRAGYITGANLRIDGGMWPGL